ncbi:MAG: hypothetical protein OEX99_02130 [Candidatus Bathyarchaeota archaeon]|nr:hypothetical protein [Candidatus Bathyarchaeota archaeon]
MNFGDWPWPHLIISVAAVLTSLFLFLAIRARGKKEPSVKLEVEEKWPLKTERTVAPEEAKRAQEQLRTLDIEREALSEALRQFYEAQAEGKITEEERERLAHRYKERMMKIRDTISRSESVVSLRELETMQDDLVKMFSERFDEVNTKIGDLRTHLKVKPLVETPVPPKATPVTAPPKERRRVPKRPPPKKTAAEKRIEEIRAEVEKVLERLGQIEVEA